MSGFGESESLERSKSSRSPAYERDRPKRKSGRVRVVINAKRRLVIATFGDHLTTADIRSYAQDLRIDPRFDSSFSEIADLRSLEELPFEATDFLELADRIDPFSRESKRAFVARTPLQNNAARLHKMLRNQRNFEIFQTLEEAEAWIAV